MATDIPTFKALPLGYLTGSDLLQFGPVQLLLSQYDIDNNSIQTACNFAYSELIGSLVTRYDVATEFLKMGDSRSLLCVKIAALLAIRNVLGNIQNISEKITNDFSWANQTLKAVRNGQMNLPLNAAGAQVAAPAELISYSFKTLG